jgi:hypothetical protein
MNFKSQINSVNYKIDLKSIFNSTNGEFSDFRITIFDRPTNIPLNIYPIYSKETNIIGWDSFNDLNLPIDLKDFCERLVRNRILL